MKKAALGSKVIIHYKGTFKDGTVFDSTEEKPFEFVVGSEMVIKGMSDALVGMQEGEKKSIEVSPEEAFGSENPELVVKVPRERLPQDVKKDDLLSDSVNGMHWEIQELTKDHAVLDANHPLAGKKLFFDIELLSIEAES